MPFHLVCKLGFCKHTQADTITSLEEEIAFAASSIQTRDVPGSNFRYAKTMTLPFFGSGMVDIPPQGYKRSKNSRKMQMVFFVHQGKVTVEVADEVFNIGKGGVWQVPRGQLLFSSAGLATSYRLILRSTMFPGTSRKRKPRSALTTRKQ